MKTSYYFEKTLEKGSETIASKEDAEKLNDFARNCFTMGNSHGYIRGLFWGSASLLASAAILKVLEVRAYRKAGVK